METEDGQGQKYTQELAMDGFSEPTSLLIDEFTVANPFLVLNENSDPDFEEASNDAVEITDLAQGNGLDDMENESFKSTVATKLDDGEQLRLDKITFSY